MSALPIDDAARAFLAAKRIAVAGASRFGDSPANGIADRLRANGHQVFLVNPNAAHIGTEPCYPSVDAIEGGVQAVVSVTAAPQSREVAEQAARAGAEWIWFHQGFGPVSFDDEGLRAAKDAGLKVIAVGCPMMYCAPDFVHACARSVFRVVGRIPREVQVGA